MIISGNIDRSIISTLIEGRPSRINLIDQAPNKKVLNTGIKNRSF